MRKKWLVTVFASEYESLLKAKQFPINRDVTDVTIPDNTLFFFFSDDEVNLEITEFRMAETAIVAIISTVSDSIIGQKLYSEGKADGKSLIVYGRRNQYRLENFIEHIERNGLKIMFI